MRWRSPPHYPSIFVLLCVAASLPACKPESKGKSPSKEALWPFPSMHQMQDGRVVLPEDTFAVGLGGTPFPVDRLTWRTGFSPVQTTVMDVGPDVDPTTLPGPAGEGNPDSIQAWDLTDGVRMRAWAELDAYPELAGENPTLLVRPLEPLPMGHQVAVVVTDGLLRTDGEPVGVAWFDAVVGGEPPTGLEDWVDHYTGLVRDLGDLGVEGVVLATDFPINDPRAPLQSMIASQTTPTSWEWKRTEDTEQGDILPKGLWRRGEGTFMTTTWLADDADFVWQDDLPAAQGDAEVELYVYLPQSLEKAPAGSAPVWIFGHGIFSSPDLYMDDGDPSGVIDLANRAGAILVATVWRGLTYGDLPIAAEVGGDFGRIPELTDKLAQGVANARAMTLLARDGGLLDDALFGGLWDGSTIRYYGISLGGIEGATLLANTPEIPYGVLHVGGSDWSYMLERSSQWPNFEGLMVAGVPSARDRQLLYAASQLFWDEADPAAFAPDLHERKDLWQMSIGDEQVPNRSTELLARGTGATFLLPATGFASDLPTGEAPMVGPAVSVFDSELGVPDDVNRPALDTGAHTTPRLWDGAKLQTARFLDPSDPGVVEHFCGDAMCSAENTGG